MLNQFLKAFPVAILALIVACGDSGDDKKSNSSDDESVLEGFALVGEGAELEKVEEGIKGNGAMVAITPLEGVSSGAHFTVSFKVAEGQAITVHSYSTNELKEGVSLKVARESDNQFKVTLIGEEVIGDLSEDFAALLTAKEDEVVTLRFDMHNDETGGHLLAWIAGPGDDVSADNAAFDEPVGRNGSGSFWGITLEGATVTAAETSDAKVEE